MNMELSIMHLYPDLLNLYGDKGNISALTKRASWRGISVSLLTNTYDGEVPEFRNADILFLGGGPDKAEEMVCDLLRDSAEELRKYIEDGGVVLATCGGLSMLGKEFPGADGMKKGLGVLEFTTKATEGRFIGNAVMESPLTKHPIVGFENRTGKALLENGEPLGKMISGYGNAGDGGAEGILYKNLIGTHLHGPLLPKNPELCDEILTRALRKKYPDFEELDPLDDSMENLANDYVVKTYGKK